MAGSLRKLFRKTTDREVAPEAIDGEPGVGRHRADTREAPISAAEPVTVGAHRKAAAEPVDG